MFLAGQIINIPLYHQITHNEKVDHKLKSLYFITDTGNVCSYYGSKLPVSTKKV